MGIVQAIKSFFRRSFGKEASKDKDSSGRTPESERRSGSSEPPLESVTGEVVTSQDDSEARSASTPVRYITIGFDLGTSCTKIVVRDPFGLDSPSYLVDFEEYGDPSIRYLLPSRLYLDKDGRARLGERQAESSISEIKVRLMHHAGEPVPGHPDARPRDLAALYVACGLRYTRRWFRRTYADIYGQDHIEWQFNLGIPAASHDDQEVCATFEKVARVAWGLSLEEGSTLERAKEAFHATEEGSFDPGIEDYNVNVVPEVAAQVAGYAQSSLRRPGLHMLVDVGAATLDVAGFILTDDEGEDRYSILTAAVHSLGAYQLEQERAEYLKQLGRTILEAGAYEKWAHEMAQRCGDPMRNVPSDMREYFPSSVRDRVEFSGDGIPDQTFEKRCFKALYAVIDDLKQNRDPNSKKWKQGLPIFLTGGGQHIRVYRSALKRLNDWRDRFMKVSPFEVKTLPSLQNLDAPHLRENDAHRFSVAYGLSFPIDDIGTIRPPHEIPDLNLESIRSPRYTYQDTKAWM